jgi:hypothetical protein
MPHPGIDSLWAVVLAGAEGGVTEAEEEEVEMEDGAVEEAEAHLVLLTKAREASLSVLGKK